MYSTSVSSEQGEIASTLVDYWNAGAGICIVLILGDDEGWGVVALVQELAIYSAL